MQKTKYNLFDFNTNQKQEITVKPSYGLDANQTKEMLLDSLKHSKEDINHRLLIEKTTEGEQDLELLKKDLADFGHLVDKTEQENIQNALTKLEEELNKKESREAIKAAHDHMVAVSENLILKKVNLALEKKVGGKNLDEF